MPLAARLVEVIADLGEGAAKRYRYGSGCIVRGRAVLTAAHVVAGAYRVQVRDPRKRLYSAALDPDFVGDANGPGPDLALVEIVDQRFTDDLPSIGLAAIDRGSPTAEPVGRCHAIGYPWFAETHRRPRSGTPSMRSACCRWPRADPRATERGRVDRHDCHPRTRAWRSRSWLGRLVFLRRPGGWSAW